MVSTQAYISIFAPSKAVDYTNGTYLPIGELTSINRDGVVEQVAHHNPVVGKRTSVTTIVNHGYFDITVKFNQESERSNLMNAFRSVGRSVLKLSVDDADFYAYGLISESPQVNGQNASFRFEVSALKDGSGVTEIPK